MTRIQLQLMFASLISLITLSKVVAEERFHVFVMDEVRTYSIDGELLSQFGFDDRRVTSGGLAFDELGVLYASPFLTTFVERYSATGAPLGQWAEWDQTDGPTLALEFDTNGVLYAGLNGIGNDRIDRFAKDGTPLGSFGETTTDGLIGAIFDIEFDGLGRVYAMDNQNIEWFDAAGNHLGVFASVPENVVPTELEFDSQGNLYVGTLIGDSVYVFSPTGEEIRRFKVPHAIYSLAISEDDLLYIGGGGIPAPAFVNVFDTFGNFQFEFASIDRVGNPKLLITQTIPEPNMEFPFWFAAALLVCLRRRSR